MQQQLSALREKELSQTEIISKDDLMQAFKQIPQKDTLFKIKIFDFIQVQKQFNKIHNDIDVIRQQILQMDVEQLKEFKQLQMQLLHLNPEEHDNKEQYSQYITILLSACVLGYEFVDFFDGRSVSEQEASEYSERVKISKKLGKDKTGSYACSRPALIDTIDKKIEFQECVAGQEGVPIYHPIPITPIIPGPEPAMIDVTKLLESIALVRERLSSTQKINNNAASSVVQQQIEQTKNKLNNLTEVKVESNQLKLKINERKLQLQEKIKQQIKQTTDRISQLQHIQSEINSKLLLAKQSPFTQSLNSKRDLLLQLIKAFNSHYKSYLELERDNSLFQQLGGLNHRLSAVQELFIQLNQNNSNINKQYQQVQKKQIQFQQIQVQKQNLKRRVNGLSVKEVQVQPLQNNQRSIEQVQRSALEQLDQKRQIRLAKEEENVIEQNLIEAGSVGEQCKVGCW